MTDVLRPAGDKDVDLKRVVTPFTYSSRCTIDGKTHTLKASRLSLMAFDAACLVAEAEGISKLLIAGEQTCGESGVETSTGHLLQADAYDRGLEIEVEALSHPTNRLLNTPYQVDRLAEHYRSVDEVQIVCWGFHRRRIQSGFKAKRLDTAISYTHVEDVLGAQWERALLEHGEAERRRRFRERYDMEVDWPVVMKRGIPPFADRERFTRVAMVAGSSGWVLKLLTQLRGVGRYDDISTLAMPVKRTGH